ncbi:hypothetical protein [Kordia sp.]|uniref:hypothetical protein n=1 Tax=Kordia sp. TaxID=1965332 RepID=UPI003B5CFAB9
MKTKTFFLLLFLSLSSFSMFAQTDMKAEEAKVLSLLKQLRSKDENINREVVAIQFEKTLKTVLSKKESWNYRFPELRTYISVATSDDKKIRTFGWDSLTGGSWHALRSFIQFKFGDKIHVVSLQDEKPMDEEEGNNILADAVILEIYPFGKGYLFEAYGTYGSGHHHKVLAYFELNQEALVRKAIFENDEVVYVFKIARKYKFDLLVNPEKATITHSEFLLDADSGFFLPTGKKVVLTFDGKQFIKQLKNEKP